MGTVGFSYRFGGQRHFANFSGGLIETKPAGERQPDYGGGFSAHERNAKKGCSYSNGVPCLDCPWDYCIAYEKSFGVARER